MKDLIVIGGGVAGLMAAGVAASEGLKVLLLEKMEKPARKLRITGKGRCNLTNIRTLEDFLDKIPQGADFARYSLGKFTNEDTVKFFESIGVHLTVERGGRVFPTSGKAWDIAEALITWARRQGVEIRCDAEVQSVNRSDSGFLVEYSQKLSLRNEEKQLDKRLLNKDRSKESDSSETCKELFSNVLITTGGVSYPATGSTGDGYQFAYDLGHSIVPLRPSLVPLDIGNVSQYKGLALKNVGLRLLVNGNIAAERFGDVDFTDRALGGAIVLQISRIAVDSIIDRKEVYVEIDLKPALSQTKLRNRIDREIESMPTANFRVLLQKLIPSALFQKVVEQSRVNLTKAITKLDLNEIENLISTLKGLRFKILDYRPFTEAIVTAGGVELSEVNAETMESKIVPKLYFAGEVLDIDADTGGFNIQVALSTAYVAAKSISDSISKSPMNSTT